MRFPAAVAGFFLAQRKGEPMPPIEAPTRTVPDVETEPGRRLSPDTLCPDQQGRVVKRIIRELT